MPNINIDDLVGRNDNNYENDFALGWNCIPEPILLNIFFRLGPKQILLSGLTCKRWNDISKDDFLWKKIMHRDFIIQNDIGLKPSSSWYSEYKRLIYHVPMIQTDELNAHTHQVLHVSFSHNGKMFATCSKDGFVIVWNALHPASIKYSHDMKKFSWRYTQFSQFNESDTLLLVSGVHFGSPHSTSGEIAVFTVTGISHLRCRVVNKPYDIFGTWFSDQHLISGDLHWLAHLVSTSVLWLNKANQEVDSEHVPIMNQLYKFYNRNASSIRSILVANCPWLEYSEYNLDSISIGDEINVNDNNDIKYPGNPLSYMKITPQPQPSTSDSTEIPYKQLDNNQQNRSIHYLEEFRKEYDRNNNSSDDDDDDEYNKMKIKDFNKNCDNYYDSDNDNDNDSEDCDDDNDDNDGYDDFDKICDMSEDLDNTCPKYLIFSTGSKTYTPHQIGFKRINKVNFPKKLDPGPPLKERIIAAKQRQRELMNNEIRPEPDWLNYDAVCDRFDKVDNLIDLHGHIIGMGLSPDHRYLYVNSRPWPQHYVISNPLEPPPIAQEIDIHVIDLTTLKRVGNMLRAHKAYTPNTECFFIFMDVCDNYVASGAEDMHAYLWDRNYGICLSRYQHNDVVNSVAFNPKDSEMLVTTSDDFKIKIWRSTAKAKLLNIENTNRGYEFRKKYV